MSTGLAVPTGGCGTGILGVCVVGVFGGDGDFGGPSLPSGQFDWSGTVLSFQILDLVISL